MMLHLIKIIAGCIVIVATTAEWLSSSVHILVDELQPHQHNAACFNKRKYLKLLKIGNKQSPIETSQMLDAHANKD